MLTNFIKKEKAGKNNNNDIDNMNNYVNDFNNKLSGSNFSLNNYSTQQRFYNTASSGFRQQKPERDVEAENIKRKVSPPDWYKKIKKKKKKMKIKKAKKRKKKNKFPKIFISIYI